MTQDDFVLGSLTRTLGFQVLEKGLSQLEARGLELSSEVLGNWISLAEPSRVSPSPPSDEQMNTGRRRNDTTNRRYMRVSLCRQRLWLPRKGRLFDSNRCMKSAFREVTFCRAMFFLPEEYFRRYEELVKQISRQVS